MDAQSFFCFCHEAAHFVSRIKINNHHFDKEKLIPMLQDKLHNVQLTRLQPTRSNIVVITTHYHSSPKFVVVFPQTILNHGICDYSENENLILMLQGGQDKMSRDMTKPTK